VIIWALLSDDEAQFIDLGPDYYAARANPERKARHHIRELQALATRSPSTPRHDPDSGRFSDQIFGSAALRANVCLMRHSYGVRSVQ
jgi:hypothetical protein